LPRPHEALLDDPRLVYIAPVPAANSVGSGKNFNLGSERKVGHKAGPIIAARTTSDGSHRRLTTGLSVALKNVDTSEIPDFRRAWGAG
jgi:hypothetical protein